MQIHHPYLSLVTFRIGLRPRQRRERVDRRPEWSVGQLRMPGCKASVGIPI